MVHATGLLCSLVFFFASASGSIDCTTFGKATLSKATESQCHKRAEIGKPNFVFVYIDDLRHMLDSDPYSDEAMPNLIQAANSRGIDFTNAACAQPVCTPSRVALLTGRRPQQTGTTNYYRNLRHGYQTIPGILHDKLGYTTVAIGKVFDSESFGSRTTKNYNNIDLCRKNKYRQVRGRHACSFDESWGNDRVRCKVAQPADSGVFTNLAENNPCQYHDFSDVTLKRGAKVDFPNAPPPPFRTVRSCANRNHKVKNSENVLYHGGKPEDQLGYGIATAGILRLQELATAGDPFFLAIGFHRPHLPLSTTSEAFKYFSDKNFSNSHPYWSDTFSDLLPNGLRPRARESNAYGAVLRSDDPDMAEDPLSVKVEATLDASNKFPLSRQAYYGVVRFIDTQVKRILDAVDGLDEAVSNNTHVIVTSDHGFMLGEYGRLGKWTLVESNTRVPLLVFPSNNLVRAFPQIQVPSKVHTPVDHTDLLPTIMDMAAIPEAHTRRRYWDRLPGTSLAPLFMDPLHAFVREVAVSEYQNHGGRGRMYALRSKFFKYVVFRYRRSRYLFDYRGGDQHRMVERENVVNDDSYRIVKNEFEKIWRRARFSSIRRRSWYQVLGRKPFDHDYSSQRGKNRPD